MWSPIVLVQWVVSIISVDKVLVQSHIRQSQFDSFSATLPLFCSAVKQAASSEESGEVLAKYDKEDDEDAEDIGQGKPTRRQVAVSTLPSAFVVCIILSTWIILV